MDNENVIEKTDPAEETHRNLYEVMFDFWKEFFDFIRFIFYGIWIGE